MEALELRVNRSQRLVLASYPSGVVLEVQAVTAACDGHGWAVVAQVFLDPHQLAAIHQSLGLLIQPPAQATEVHL